VCSLRYPACNAHAPYAVFIPVAFPVTPHFPTLSHKMHDFLGWGGGGGNATEHKTCVCSSHTHQQMHYLLTWLKVLNLR